MQEHGSGDGPSKIAKIGWSVATTKSEVVGGVNGDLVVGGVKLLRRLEVGVWAKGAAAHTPSLSRMEAGCGPCLIGLKPVTKRAQIKNDRDTLTECSVSGGGREGGHGRLSSPLQEPLLAYGAEGQRPRRLQRPAARTKTLNLRRRHPPSSLIIQR
jgi:hypothetical protein